VEIPSPFNGLEIITPEDSFDSLGHLPLNQTVIPLSTAMFNGLLAMKLEDVDLATLLTLMVEILDLVMALLELAL